MTKKLAEGLKKKMQRFGSVGPMSKAGFKGSPAGTIGGTDKKSATESKSELR